MRNRSSGEYVAKNQRKMSNYIIDRKSLARLSIPFFVLAGLSIAIVFAIQWRVIKALQQTELHGVENLPAMNALLDIQSTVMRIGIIGLVIFCIVCFFLWVLFSHKIFGPTVPMRRHVQSLTAGDYSSRITPRPGDEFKDLIEDLNQLAEALSRKKS